MALNCKRDIFKFLGTNPELKNRLLDEFKSSKNHIINEKASLKGSPAFFKILGITAIKMFFAFLIFKWIGESSDSEFFTDVTNPVIFSFIIFFVFSFNLIGYYATRLKLDKNNSTFAEIKLLLSEIFYDTIRSKKSINRQKHIFNNTYISLEAMSIISEYIDRETFSMILDDKLTYAQIGIENENEIRKEFKIYEEKKQEQIMLKIKEQEKAEKLKTKKEKKEELLDYLYKDNN